MSTLTMRAIRRVPTAVLRARDGYDLAAEGFLAWHWTKFWRRNEAPLVRGWLNDIAPGLGLDAGTGIGPYLKDATAAGHRYIALDISGKMLAAANPLRRGRLAWAVQSDLRELPVKDGRLDWVLSTRVLSNNAEPERILSEFARVMRRGAECLITDVHPDHPYEQTSITAGERVLVIETHRHALSQVVALASRSFRVVRCVEHGLKDLPRRPPKSLFKKIYENSSSPIFYFMMLKRK